MGDMEYTEDNPTFEPLISRAGGSIVPSEDATPGITPSQKCGYYLSHLLAVTAVTLVCVWVGNESMGGGISWTVSGGNYFNWHPVMMTLTFSFMTVAALAFRVPAESVPRKTRKTVHGAAWAVAGCCAAFGISAVFAVNDDPDRGYGANLYSLHSWAAMFVIGLFLFQFLAGLGAFALAPSLFLPSTRGRIMAGHRFLGPFVYVATAATLLLGVSEVENFLECDYSVQEPDVIPFRHTGDIPTVCLIGHSLGVVVLVMALSTSYVLWDFRSREVERPPPSVIAL